MDASCAIVELRQYTLHPGRRDDLIDLFDREFIEPQEELGMRILGQFRVIDDPDRFLWLRGFSDMNARREGLSRFYGGPIWKAHKDAANATMIDSDNVLLLRPPRPGSGFDLSGTMRPALGTDFLPHHLYIVTIYYFRDPQEGEFVPYFERAIAPVAARGGAAIRAYFVTERSRNDYPDLPVREDENVFAWFAAFPDLAAYDDYTRFLEQSPDWQDTIGAFASRLSAPIEIRKLTPTSRSLVR
jgi:hypothetical protein